MDDMSVWWKQTTAQDSIRCLVAMYFSYPDLVQREKLEAQKK